jgi:protoporphyrinogen oxidase
MPVRDLSLVLGSGLSPACRNLAASLVYRDFFTVGLLLDSLELTEEDGSPLRDNWIYVHDSRVLVGRLQFFKNWSPFMVRDEKLSWVGMEYFCNEEDAIWNLPEEEIVNLASRELEVLGIARASSVRGGCRIHAPKAYPVYLGEGYERFQEIRNELDAYQNLFLIGRNGMHRYNNMDHSMLSAMAAVKAACAGGGDKSEIWRVNSEWEYAEERKT